MKKRVVYLMRQAVGGMQTHLFNLVSQLNKEKFDLWVLAPRSETLKENLAKLKVPLIEVEVAAGIRPFKDLKTILNLRRLLQELKPQIFHIHSNKGALLGRLAARFSRVSPAIIVTVHNFLVFQERSYLERKLASLVERWLAAKTDKIITVSEGLKKSLVKIEGIPAEKIVTIRNGIDLEKWRGVNRKNFPRQKLGFSSRDFIIGTIGRMVPFKGQKFLLDALLPLLKKYPQVRAVIIGDGPLRKSLEAQAQNLNIEKKVNFLGFVPDTKSYLANFDLFVLPSLKEPFGIVLLEAMAARIPVVSTQAGGVPEIIEGKKEGILVPPGDSQALGKALEELITSPNLGQELAEKAYLKVKKKFSLEKMIQETENLYNHYF